MMEKMIKGIPEFYEWLLSHIDALRNLVESERKANLSPKKFLRQSWILWNLIVIAQTVS